MNPYSRFRLISNIAAAALMAGALCAAWPVGSALLVSYIGGPSPAYTAAVAGIAAGLVLASLIVTEWVFPAVFQMAFLRRIVLGRHYVEGTWLQAERGPSGSERLTVLHLRPSGYGFDLSGYCLNQESEIESNRMIEYSKLDGPVLTYAYRSLMPDGAGNQARGMGELMFEQRRGAPKAYSGHGEPIGARRFQVEGVKLTNWSERRKLRKLEHRSGMVTKYWGLFFGGTAGMAEEAAPVAAPVARRPVIVSAIKPETASAPFVERRNSEAAPVSDGPVITRRRASDWRGEDATPTADRIRARMMRDAEEIADEEEDLLLEEEIEDEIEYEADSEDEVLLEDEAEELEDEEEEYEADAEDDEDAFEAEDEAELEEELDEEDGEEEYEADAEDDEDVEDDAAEEVDAAVTEEEPVRIRQRYARR